VISGKRFIPAPHGRLEAIHQGQGRDRVAVVLHPHPLYGGTMHNPVVYAAAHGLDDAGFETLRINFRGVGESTGEHDEGRGEVEDARAALDFLLAARADAPAEVVVAGYSFGAAVALRLASSDPRVTRVIAIATPASTAGDAALASAGVPRLFLHGERDELAPLARLRERLPAGADEIRTLSTDHFFSGETDRLRELVRDWAAIAPASARG
jgi:alpha/beta superfamily hydrolase